MRLRREGGVACPTTCIIAAPDLATVNKVLGSRQCFISIGIAVYTCLDYSVCSSPLKFQELSSVFKFQKHDVKRETLASF